MQAAAGDGVACIVDGGHTDMGRDIEFIRALSERSGMPIVASGGYYHEPTFTQHVYDRSEEELVEEMVRDAAAERWGAFGEIGFSSPSIPAERKVLRAVGRTHLRTNLPIFTHTANGVEAEEQLDLLEAVGVDPARVVIGHLGYPDVTVHADLCRRGAYVGFDRLGGQPEADAAQVPMVLALIEGGFADRVLLASDFALPADTRGNGGPGYGKTITRFVPLLREAGRGRRHAAADHFRQSAALPGVRTSGRNHMRAVPLACIRRAASVLLACACLAWSAPARAQHGAAGGEWPTYGGRPGQHQVLPPSIRLTSRTSTIWRSPGAGSRPTARSIWTRCASGCRW